MQSFAQINLYLTQLFSKCKEGLGFGIPWKGKTGQNKTNSGFSPATATY